MQNGNGYDSEENEDGDSEIIRFPTLAERDRLRREKEKAEKEKRKKPSNDVPFFNTARIPPLTRIIIGAFLAVHLPLYLFVDDGTRLQIFYLFGFVPGYYTGAMDWSITALIAPLTHLFIHGSWMHLAFNSVMMLAMGMFMETAYGTRRMLIFFLFSGLCGAALFFALNPFATAPVIGASGSISGLFAVTFLTLYQMGRLGPVGRRGPWPLILFWIFLITGIGFIGGDIAWQAHLGGFLGALGLYYARRRRWVSF